MAAPVKVARQQTISPEPSEPCLRNYTNTCRNSSEPSGTYTNTRRNGTFRNPPFGTFRNLYLRNLPQHTPEPSEIFRNLPEFASGTYASTHQNSPEPSGTCFRNLHQHTPQPSGTASGTYLPPEPTPPELSGTLWNLPPGPAPATRTGTHRSLSGLKTPLAYACCWGKSGAVHTVYSR